MRFFAPLYFAYLSFALIEFQTKGQLRHQRSVRKMKLIYAAVVVVGCGAGLHLLVWTHQSDLNEWGMKWLENIKAPESVGLSTSPNLGSTFGNQGSMTRVLRVQNGDAHPHLRAMSFDTYLDGRWFPVGGQRDFETIAPAALNPKAQGERALFSRLLDDEGVVFAPLESVGVIVDAETKLEITRRDGPLRTTETLPTPFLYEVILPQRNQAASTRSIEKPTDEDRARYLQVPESVDARVRLLASAMNAQTETPPERIEAVVNYLQTHHQYSLKTTRGEGDPVSNFLLERKSAHCEYFASAATILLRCMNVPTRYVVGYYAHESDGARGTVVRLRDAHAWAESYIEGVGWVTVEATPASGTPPFTAEKIAPWQKWRENFQDIVAAWRTAILASPRALATLVACCIAWLGVWLGVRAWCKRKSSTRSFSYSAPQREVALLHRRFERLLKRRGLRCAPCQTWRERLGNEPQTLMEKGAVQFLEVYEARRFSVQRTESQTCETQQTETRHREECDIEELRVALRVLQNQATKEKS